MAWQGDVLEGVLEEFAARSVIAVSRDEVSRLGFSLVPDRSTDEYRARHVAEVARYQRTDRGKASQAAYRDRVREQRRAADRARYARGKQAAA